MACGNKTPDCQKIMDTLKADAASSVRADANGSGTFPGVAPGTYYLMITTSYNNKAITWGQAVQLKPGANSMTLSLQNATPASIRERSSPKRNQSSYTITATSAVQLGGSAAAGKSAGKSRQNLSFFVSEPALRCSQKPRIIAI